MTTEVRQGLTFERLREAVAELLDIEPATLAPDDDLVRQGIDSISVMRLVALWRREGVEARFAELIERPTLRAWHELLQAQGATAAAPEHEEAPPLDEGEPFELGTLQLAYWIGRSPDRPLGVGAHFYAEFEGDEVSPPRLEAAIRRLVERHAMLRARFNADATQQVDPQGAWPGLTVHDLRGLLPADALAAELDALRARLSHRKLDVERGEVFDIQLARLPVGRSRLYVDFEMLVADAHSFRIVLSDLAHLYERPDEPLPPIGYGYGRYLAERAQRRSEARAAARRYWQARLDDLPGPPQLPLAVEPERVADPHTTRRYRWLAPEEWGRLAERSREHGVTLSMALAAAFAEVLAAWSAKPQFLLNLPFYDRELVHPDVAHLVGDFTSLLLLAVDAGEERPFAERARELQAQLRADALHAEYTGVDVLRDLARARPGEPASAPVVFTSAISLGELFDDRVRRSFGEPVWTLSQTPQVWLDHQATEREGGLLLNWEAVEELFPEGMLDAMFGAFERLLDRLAAPGSDWDRPLPELLPAEQARVREAVNRTDGPLPARCLHEGFFALAVERPERPALLFGDDETVSYGVLRERALRLGGLLRRRGLDPGETVAVCLPKGPAQVEAVLGVLAAGGVYVPVGVDQPPQRRERICASAGVRLAVTDDPGGLPAGVAAVTPTEAAQAEPLPAPHSGDPDGLAYVIYTSGSTGEPKGVMVSHRAATNTIVAIDDRWRVGPEDRALAVSALDFDLSVYDVFGLLDAGGSVAIPDEDARRDPTRWLELVRGRGVTILNCVPALLDMLLEAGGEEGVGSTLRLVLLGGDWVGLDLPGRLAAVRPGCRFVALGGTTETAIHSTVCEVDEVPPHWRSTPYGTPLRNVRCRVVDARGRDCPDWVPGELWIGGASVAEGYRGDPERTARQFVERDGVRWYRTGDLGRYWPDGTLEFLGRSDHQIKIRGHRIELGEVESALEAHPQVARAVALAVGEAGQRLATALVPREVAIEPESLREFLAERLPAYMLPEQVLSLDAFPLSANGKVDRRELRRLLEEAASERAAGREPPRGPVEAAVAEAWEELLGIEGVGRDDTFFALGGDSLVATRLLTRLRNAGVVGGDLRRLFSFPVLREFAVTLSLAEGEAAAPAVLPADPARRHEPFPPTDVQRAYWLGRSADFTLGGVGSHWYWEFDGAGVDSERLEEALNRLVARHEMLRAVFDGNGMQRILPEVPRFVVPGVDTDEAGAEAALAALREEMAHAVPDPERWPLLDVRVVRHGDRTRVAFGFDYIVLDALSIMNVFSELSRLYEDLEAELPPLGVSFRDYVLGAAPDDDAVAVSQAYWRGRAAELPPAPQLPLRTDPALVASPRFTRRAGRLGAEQWARIVERGRRHDLTQATLLGAAFAEVLSAWSARPDLTLNCTLFDRREVHPDIYNVLGDFTSLLLVRHAPEPGEPWLATARRLQEDVWDGMAHRDVSAVWVIRELARLAQTPEVSMPVVFTSALGVAPGGFDLSTPFGELAWGLSQTPQVWLDCQVMERRGELLFNWDAVEELFPEGMLDAMFAAFERLLAWLAEPGSEWAEPLPELLPEGQARVRDAVNRTDGPLPARCLHEGFFARASERPERPAVLFADDDAVSYGELRGRALRVAGLLAERGLQPGETVAVCLPKGPAQVEAVLGVLAAGGVYVPVGVDQPPRRRERICASAGVRLALTDDPSRMPAGVEPLTPAQAGQAEPLPEPVPVDPDALAYVIYTSGSTGEPKGVMVSHRAAANTIAAIGDRWEVGPDDRVFAVSALDFDLSVYDVFGLLDAGGALVVPEEEARREAVRWVELARRHGVTLWDSVPALLDMLLVAAEGRGLPESLRLALVSGDWVGLDLPGRLAALRPGCRFLALGGATEAGIWSNALEVDRVDEAWRSIPYGFPLRNQRFRVVDARGRDCPDWVPGELWIGGASVAEGYRGDPERTARQFVEREGVRWYRTGDLGRYWPDGTLEFLGRSDHQIKIRGHRIELGEVESALEAHPQVARAVALAVGERARRLAAFVVPRDGLAVDELATFLAERLPDPMLPEQIRVLDELPLTPNGKVDRRQLSKLAEAGAEGAAGAPPQGPVEAAVAEEWARLLELEAVARDDDFFGLGGDSLLATRLVEALHRRFGVELTLRRLFAAPTVAELAAAVEAERGRVGELVEEGVV